MCGILGEGRRFIDPPKPSGLVQACYNEARAVISAAAGGEAEGSASGPLVPDIDQCRDSELSTAQNWGQGFAERKVVRYLALTGRGAILIAVSALASASQCLRRLCLVHEEDAR
jgi:hypothetical protein